MINRHPAKNTACHTACRGTSSAHCLIGRMRDLKSRNLQKIKMEKNVDTQSHLSKLVTFHWCSWWAATICSFSCKLINQEAVAPGQGWVSARRLHVEGRQSLPHCSGGRALFSTETSLHLNRIDVLLTQLSCLWLLGPPGRKNPECQYLKQKQSHRLSMNTRKILAYTLAGRFVLYADMGPFLACFLSTFSLFCHFRKTWKGSGREKQTTTP